MSFLLIVYIFLIPEIPVKAVRLVIVDIVITCYNLSISSAVRPVASAICPVAGCERARLE